MNDEKLVKRGPQFVKEDGKVLFLYRSDASSVVGPREATEQDKAQYPEAWAEFRRLENVDPLDQDADGAPGGKLKGAVKRVAPKPRSKGR